MKPATLALIVATLYCPLLTGCGSSGTWEDDARNWRRAFSSDLPPGVAVVHSRYWRSPHFTLEFEYFFELRVDDPNALDALKHGLTRYADQETHRPVDQFFGDRPAWFIAGPLEQYEIWIEGTGAFSHRKLFIDKTSGAVFVTDFQV